MIRISKSFKNLKPLNDPGIDLLISYIMTVKGYFIIQV